MAREAQTVFLEENGDQLQFTIKPMSAFASLMWTKKALAVFDVSKMQSIGKQEQNADALGAMFLSRLAEIPDDTFESLVDGLLKCCCIVRQSVPVQLTKDNIDGFFYDRNTLIQLLAEALKINNFFQMNAPSESKKSQKSVDIKRRG